MDNSRQLLFSVILKEPMAASFQYRGAGVFHAGILGRSQPVPSLSPLSDENERWAKCQLEVALPSAVLSDEGWLIIQQRFILWESITILSIYC